MAAPTTFEAAAPMCLIGGLVLGETGVPVDPVQAFFARKGLDHVVGIEVRQQGAGKGFHHGLLLQEPVLVCVEPFPVVVLFQF